MTRRQRRLRVTIAILVLAALAGTAIGVRQYRARRATAYEPGESNSDITQALARGIPADAPSPRFSDVTRKSGLDGFRTFAGDRTSQLPEDMGPGAAWGDFDNDGDDDLFLVSAGGALTLPPAERAPSELYENLGNGTFRRVADLPETRIIGMGAAWGDYNGDGWLDLIVTGYNTLILYRNEHGRFVRDRRFPEPKGLWAGAVWGDYDRDGRLDLYVCGYVRYREREADHAGDSEQYGVVVPYTLNPASYEPEPNLLFHNNGDGTFTEVAQRLGVANPEGRSLSALWHDFDDDGWLDVYVANDISDNVFYRNRGGKFEDVSNAAWVADYRGAMGLAAGDWNRDGDDDLFITHWLAQENALYDSLLKDIARRPNAPAQPPPGGAAGPAWSEPHGGRPPTAPLAPATGARRGAMLRFVDAADMVGLGQIALPMVGWGTEFADFDLDGWLDLVVANGSTVETEQPPKQLKPQPMFLFWNRRGEYFHDLAPLNPVLATPHVARGLAVSDYDNDGAVDILIVRHREGVQLLRNEMQKGNWLKVRLRSRLRDERPPRGFGDGASVTAHVGEAILRRSVTSASSTA